MVNPGDGNWSKSVIRTLDSRDDFIDKPSFIRQKEQKLGSD